MDFEDALGGEVGGRVEGNQWVCSCGEAGAHADPALALYFHRRSGHQKADDVIVEEWNDSDDPRSNGFITWGEA